jgi:hypothetical protein
MIEWMKKNQRPLSLGVGSLLMVVALAMFFWSYEQSELSHEEKMAQASIARMEARNTGVSQSQSQPTVALEKYYESREKQIRYVLIIMVIGGFGLLVYGFLNKPQES